MKTRAYHRDITQPAAEPVVMPYHDRSRLQIEMIQDHAALTNAADLDTACVTWVTEGYAQMFANHYIPMKVC